MAWSASNVSAAMLANVFTPAAPLSWSADTILVAFYNNSITPDPNAAFAGNAYNAGQWATSNEQYQAGQWAQGGVALTSKTNTFAAGAQQLSAGVTSSGASCTLSGLWGCLVYDGTLAGKNAFCWNYFGSAQSVSAGILTVVWPPGGIMQITVT